MTDHPRISDVGYGFEEELGDLFITNSQDITDDYMDGLKDERLNSANPAKDLHKVASVPVVVVEKWLREGFDIYRESARAILKRLRQENLGAFITSNKRI